MQAKTKKISEKPEVKRMVETIVRCKWSLTVLALVRDGIVRPGAMERRIEGLTTKVLHERRRKPVRFGILEKTLHPETPPRVEHRLTAFGRKFNGLIETIESLEREISGEQI